MYNTQQVQQPKTSREWTSVLTMGPVIDGYKYIYMHNPSVEAKRFEEKLDITIRICVIGCFVISDGILKANVETPTMKISNLNFQKVYREEDGLWHYKTYPLNGTEYNGYTFEIRFTMDCNGDKYFDRELSREKVPLRITFNLDEDRFYKEQTKNNKGVNEAFIKEYKSFKIDTSFYYSNYIESDGETIRIPHTERDVEGETVEELCHEIKILPTKRKSSIVEDIFAFDPVKGVSIIVRGYDVSFFSDNKTFEFENRRTFQATDKISFQEGYDYDIYENKFKTTEIFKGVNFCNSSYPTKLSANLYLKVGNSNFKIKYNKTYENHVNNHLNLTIKDGDLINDQEYKEI